MNRVNKFLEAISSFLSIFGALLVSNQLHWGWVIWVVASILGTLWGVRSKNYYVAIMYSFFTLTNAMGIWNYLISPYLTSI